MTRDVRVLILNERDPDHPKAGGAEVHVAEIFGRLAGRGFAVTQVTSGFAGGAARDTRCGMQVVRVGALPGYYLRAAAVCARESRGGRVDVLGGARVGVPHSGRVDVLRGARVDVSAGAARFGAATA